MQQGILRSVHEGRGRVPPVIYHGGEVADAFDIVPPERRIEEHVARLQLGHFPGSHGLGKARIACKVRITEIHHADDLPARRRLQRTRIEIGHLFRREQGEAPLAHHAAGEVVGHVIMG